MAEIKFHCPECKQKIAAQPSAVGMKIDCPRCGSTIVIPASPEAPVVVEVKRRLAVVPGSQESLYQAIEDRQKKLQIAEAALEKSQAEVQSVRTETQHVREDLIAALKERETLAGRLSAVEATRDAANAAQVQLAELRAENVSLKVERDEASDRAKKAEESTSAIRDRLVEDEGNRAELKAQINLFQGQAERWQSEIADLQQQLEVSRTERDSFHDQYRVMEGSREGVKTQLEDREVDLAKAIAAAVSAEKDLSEREEVLAKVTAGAEAVKRDLIERESALAKATATVESAQREIKEREEALARITATADAAQSALKEREDALAKAMATAETAQREVKERDAALAKMAASAESARRELREREEALSRATASAEPAKRDLKEHEEALTKARAEAEAAQRELATLRETVSRPEASPVAKHAPVPAAELGEKPAPPDFRELQERLAHAEDAGQVYQSLIEESDRNLTEAQRRLKAVIAERDRFAAFLGNVKEKAGKGITAELERLKTAHDQIEANASRLQANLVRNADYIQTLESERDQLKAELDLAKSALERSREQPAAIPSNKELAVGRDERVQPAKGRGK